MRTLAIMALVLSFVTMGMAGASDTGLEGKWRIESLKAVDSLDSSKTEIVFLKDGGVAMTVGCNRMRGSPEIKNSMIEFGHVAGTLMACPPPLDSVEMHFHAALDAARSYTVEDSGKVLMFSSEDGEALVRLVRVE